MDERRLERVTLGGRVDLAVPLGDVGRGAWRDDGMFTRLDLLDGIRRRRILECVTSLFSITPRITLQSSISPPGIFSIRAYRLISTFFVPSGFS